MKRLYLDSNVVLDFALNRQPFVEAAESLLAAGQMRQAVLLVSSLTFITAHYVIGKALGKAVALQFLADLAPRLR